MGEYKTNYPYQVHYIMPFLSKQYKTSLALVDKRGFFVV